MDSDQNQHVGQRQSQGNDRNSKSCARLWHSGGRRFRWAAWSAAHSEGDLEVTGIETNMKTVFYFVLRIQNYVITYILWVSGTPQSVKQPWTPTNPFRFDALKTCYSAVVSKPMQISTFSFTELFLQSYSGLFKWARRKTGGDQRCFLGLMIPWWFIRPFVWQKILRSASLQCLWQEWQADFQLCRPLCFLFWTRTYCWIFFSFLWVKQAKTSAGWFGKNWQALKSYETPALKQWNGLEQSQDWKGISVITLLCGYCESTACILQAYRWVSTPPSVQRASSLLKKASPDLLQRNSLFKLPTMDGAVRYGVGKSAWCSNGWGGQEPTTGRWRRRMFGGKVPRLLLFGSRKFVTCLRRNVLSIMVEERSYDFFQGHLHLIVSYYLR